MGCFALINILDPHNWTNLNKCYQYFLLRLPIEGVISEFTNENGKDQTDHYDRMSKQAQFRGWVIDRAPQVPRGNYDISKILELI